MNRGAVLIAVLLVSSAIAPAGLAQTATSTETQTEWKETLAGSPARAAVDVRDVDGQITVEFGTDGAPGGGYQPLARETVDTAALDRGFVTLENDAYENIVVTATLEDGATGQPEIVDGSEQPITATQKVLGLAADTDLTCDPAERLHGITSPFEAQPVECSSLPGTTTVNTTNTDAEQVKIDIHEGAYNQNAASQNYLTTVDNRLSDAQTMALIIGKNTYIRALNNHSREAVATSKAKDAIDEYYAKIQLNLINQWRLQTSHGQYMSAVAANESGVDDRFAKRINHTNTPGSRGTYTLDSVDMVEYGHGSETVTLANGTSVSVPTTRAEYQMSYTGGASQRYAVFSVTGMETNDDDVEVHGLNVDVPNSNYDQINYLYSDEYHDAWNQTTEQNAAAKAQIDTLVNNTYSEYQAGDINNSDLVDPYVFQHEMKADGNYQGWAAAQLTMLGTNSPEAMDSMGRFSVSAESGEYTGVLMSQTNPASGQFAVNQTYDPANISGTQYVVTDSQIHELTTPFEIRSIETTDGERRQNVTIEKTTYETADVNTTQLAKLYENLAYERAQWEAREQDLGGGGGGGFLGGGSIDQTVALLALAALAGAALLGNS
ncbi:hypothetical protein [Halomicrobium mukohataei]|uniref:hypothetical protein n=1 Tax=Halomicrobium mukohataei TaxID=57705 RepID=UPI00197DE6CF|nr:hypothetical protein [Halomicrobium mukohataei]